MSRFAVDTESLTHLAASVRASTEEAEVVAGDRHALAPAVAALADPGLVGAVTEFLERWSHAIRSLLDDARRLADGAELAARAYDDAEVAACLSPSGTGGGGP